MPSSSIAATVVEAGHSGLEVSLMNHRHDEVGHRSEDQEREHQCPPAVDDHCQRGDRADDDQRDAA
jgi:hypothetical protein